ncbi:hypothetical protein LTR70_010150 [Exophiala xenobiotica]|uniref:Uncharacterized protein n=1 Tax=Lithohypha guttulata TaxID=1690604 RepID=A0ABR0JUZ2_9EURO|nr:hypothetical protein LTR24_010107 [Lithohypha guttulata]KAK5309598.1 hypothetical protein LTR70_010150 [Exophiala xenobiotica]
MNVRSQRQDQGVADLYIAHRLLRTNTDKITYQSRKHDFELRIVVGLLATHKNLEQAYHQASLRGLYSDPPQMSRPTIRSELVQSSHVECVEDVENQEDEEDLPDSSGVLVSVTCGEQDKAAQADDKVNDWEDDSGICLRTAQRPTPNAQSRDFSLAVAHQAVISTVKPVNRLV